MIEQGIKYASSRSLTLEKDTVLILMDLLQLIGRLDTGKRMKYHPSILYVHGIDRILV